MTAEARAVLPGELRERVLAAARAARAAGRALPEIPDISPTEAFGRAGEAFLDVLAALPDEAWRTPVLRDLDVQGLVGHLIGVEHDVQRALTGDRTVADADHVASTQPAADAQVGRSPEETRREWRAAADDTLARARSADLDVVVAVHGMRLPLRSLLVVRAFELWTHDNDVRHAVGLPAGVPDPATLRLMTDLAVRLLPYGVARVADEVPPLDLHLVLTGAGGGTWDVGLGERPDQREVPDVGIVADAIDFCRLVADRIGPTELRVQLSGAIRHARAVLAGAAALALD